jgi:GT2 family glycosyltransferase
VKTIALVTVTFNAEDNLSFFLPSIERNLESIGVVFFVDNNSSDNTFYKLNGWKKEVGCPVDVTLNEKNFGYAYAINTGIQKAREAGFEHILVTNNDVIFEEGMLDQMLKDLKDSGADVMGIPSSINQHEVGLGYMLSKDLNLPTPVPPIQRGEIQSLSIQNPLPPVDFVHGGTILFTKRFFDTIGLYDGDLFFGGDEIDFLYRVHSYNKSHTDKITCIVSLRAFLMMDNLSKHNTRHKVTKALRILQGTARVYLKHRFTPESLGLYKVQYKIITSLAKGSWFKYIILYAFSVRALFLEIVKYYKGRLF